MNRHNSHWTREKVALARELWMSMVDVAGIVARLGGDFRPSSIYGKAKREGWPERKTYLTTRSAGRPVRSMDDPIKTRVRELLDQGLKPFEIGAVVGYSKSTIERVICRIRGSEARIAPVVAEVVDEPRKRGVREPLPAGHPSTWSLISQHPWPGPDAR